MPLMFLQWMGRVDLGGSPADEDHDPEPPRPAYDHAPDDSEGTPLAIMEAMGSGLPVISTKHGGIVDVITDNENGLLVNENDVETMSEKMLYLINNTLVAKTIGQNAAEHISKNYSLDSYTQKLNSLIEKTVLQFKNT